MHNTDRAIYHKKQSAMLWACRQTHCSLNAQFVDAGGGGGGGGLRWRAAARHLLSTFVLIMNTQRPKEVQPDIKDRCFRLYILFEFSLCGNEG